MTNLRSFKIEVPQAVLDGVRNRVAAFPWHEMPRGEGLEGTWAYGANLDYMRELCAYWVEKYDWWKWEAEFNRFPQFLCEAEGLDVFFLKEEGSGDKPLPLILTHGWPGSVFEFLAVIEKLAHPERFGGDVKDAFTVVVPSLPGYGWSAKPKQPIGPRTVGRMFDALMTKDLGFKEYLAQGGDWGAAVSGWLGYEGSGCKAVHMNMMGWYSPGALPETEEEKAHAARAAQLLDAEGAYFRQQTTKPQTLSYAMMDSPVGICAWIVEKFHGWSDIRDGFESVYSKDQLLTNVMTYIVTNSFNTASWMYRGRFDDRSGTPVPKGARVEKPVAVANFPVDIIPFPPRSQVEKSINVARWTDFKRGGHFAMLERPDDLIADIRSFAKDYR